MIGEGRRFARLLLCLLTAFPGEVAAAASSAEPPSFTERPMITGISSRSVNLSWTYDPADRVLHYLVEYRTAEDGLWNDSSSRPTVVSGNQTACCVTGLWPFTPYVFRVTAVTDIGPTQPSAESYPTMTLRELPSREPEVLSTTSTNHSISISWTPLSRRDIHGELLGYRIVFTEEETMTKVAEIVWRRVDLTSYTIRNLDPFTWYRITLQAINPLGEGPISVVSAATDEGVPSKPRNVVTEVTSMSVKLWWLPPDAPAGILTGYTVWWRLHNATLWMETGPHPDLPFEIPGLEPYTTIQIWVTSRNTKLTGDPSDALLVTTDVDGSSMPTDVNLKCHSSHAALLTWKQPATVYKVIDSYLIYYHCANEYEVLEVQSMGGNEEAILGNLTKAVYEITICGVTKSIVDSSKLYLGQFSDACLIDMQKCNGSDSAKSAVSFMGVIILVAILLVPIGYTMWRTAKSLACLARVQNRYGVYEPAELPLNPEEPPKDGDLL